MAMQESTTTDQEMEKKQSSKTRQGYWKGRDFNYEMAEEQAKKDLQEPWVKNMVAKILSKRTQA